MIERRCLVCGNVFSAVKRRQKYCSLTCYWLRNSQSVRRCTHCGRELPATPEYFSANRGKPKARCKKCDHAYYEQNKAIALERAQQRYKTHREEIQAQHRARYVPRPRKRATPESRRASKRRYLEANRDRVNAKSALYRKNHPLKEAEHRLRRRARKAQLPATLRAEDWQHALDYFGCCCAVCGRPRGLWHTLAADHWIPLAKGGPTTPDNIVPLCHGKDGCNNSKSTFEPDEWVIKKFGKRKGSKILRRIKDYFDSLK